MSEGYTPGGDAKVIAEIAKTRFGSFEKMFEHHGWPERGPDMMRKVQTRVAETYGSVKAFEQYHSPDRDAAGPWGLIDPPSAFESLDQWERFLAEMQAIRPPHPAVDLEIRNALAVVAEKKAAERGRLGPATPPRPE